MNPLLYAETRLTYEWICAVVNCIWLYWSFSCFFWFSLPFHSLLQSADESVAEEVKVMLKSIIPELKKVQNSKGVEVLLEKLAWSAISDLFFLSFGFLIVNLYADVCKYKTCKNTWIWFSFFNLLKPRTCLYRLCFTPKSMETFSWKLCYNVDRNAI